MMNWLKPPPVIVDPSTSPMAGGKILHTIILLDLIPGLGIEVVYDVTYLVFRVFGWDIY